MVLRTQWCEGHTMVSDLNTVGETGLLWLRLKKHWQRV